MAKPHAPIKPITSSPFWAMVRITRPWNVLMVGISMALIHMAWISPGLWQWGTAQFLTSIAIMMVLAASGNVINDYFDVAEDAVNKPHRALVGTRPIQKICVDRTSRTRRHCTLHGSSDVLEDENGHPISLGNLHCRITLVLLSPLQTQIPQGKPRGGADRGTTAFLVHDWSTFRGDMAPSIAWPKRSGSCGICLAQHDHYFLTRGNQGLARFKRRCSLWI